MIFSIEPFVTDNIILLSILLFIAGVVEDILDTWVTFAVVKRQTVTTGLITFFGIVLEFTVFISFISNLDKWPVIIVYALGATVGSVGVVEYQKLLTRRKKEQTKLKRLKGYRKMRLAKLKAERTAREVASKLKKVVKVPTVVKKTPTIESKPEVKTAVKKSETPTSTIKSSPTGPST